MKKEIIAVIYMFGCLLASEISAKPSLVIIHSDNTDTDKIMLDDSGSNRIEKRLESFFSQLTSHSFSMINKQSVLNEESEYNLLLSRAQNDSVIGKHNLFEKYSVDYLLELTVQEKNQKKPTLFVKC